MDNLLTINISAIKVYLPQIISSIVLIAAATAIRIVTRKLINSYASIHTASDLRVQHVNRVTNIVVNAAAIIILIAIWGVDTKNIFLTLSSVFAVIGVALFAQWSVLSNITSGVILFFSPAYRIGTYIKILDKDLPVEAKIEDIFAFYTHLRSKEGELHIFPNNLLLQKAIQIIQEKADEDPGT
ncbi:MAG: mechanosensitive ion channel [Paludibacter sp.]|jgi:small-conductance mechanosensitive channel|nr:mechanosensitive ion channel [Paludibacter sp.]